jgi:hypothetical protein
VPEEPTKVDLAASDACVRSGTFALLLSVALLLLIPSWREQPNYSALARYLGDRLNLASQVDRLNDDPFWLRYKASNPGAESMSIAELRDVQVVVSSTGEQRVTVPNPALSSSHRTPKASRASHHTPNVSPAGPARPAAPSTAPVLSAVVNINLDEMRNIADTLGELNDSEVLAPSRRVSNFFAFSIARWVEKRNGLAYRNQNTNRCFGEDLEAPHPVKKSSDFIPPLKNEGMLKCLSLGDVRELARMDLPTFLGSPQLGREHVGPQIDITVGSFPHDLYAASILAQVLLFFVIVHFSAFVREAVSSPHFPVPGTLFSAFSRSRATLFIFILATFGPSLASALVCWASWESASVPRRLSLLVCTVLIVWAFSSIQLVLWRSSYYNCLMHRGN